MLKPIAVGDEVKDKALISQIVLRDELVDGLSGIYWLTHICLCSFT